MTFIWAPRRDALPSTYISGLEVAATTRPRASVSATSVEPPGRFLPPTTFTVVTGAEAAVLTVGGWYDAEDLASAAQLASLVGIVDLGLKANIVRSMRRRGARVRVFPHTVSASDVLSSDIDGIVLSPGPGDPARLTTREMRCLT